MTKPNKERRREAERSAHELCEAELNAVTGGLSLLMVMRHEMLKAVANNLRG